MDRRLTASKLIRFGPRGEDALPPATPTARLSVAIETELRGVRTRVQADGSRLFTELTVAFSRIVQSVCSRVRMTGLVPADHAEPTGLNALAYNGSTCGIRDAFTPIPLYRQVSAGVFWLLSLNWPARNLYSFYGQWPRASYVVDPALVPGEAAPIITLSLERFEGFSGGSDDGVAYPMKLLIDLGSSTVEIARLNRADSPQITGGAGSLSGRENPFWTITSDEIAHAMSDLEPGVYPIDLVIYEGHGRQVYRGHCRSFVGEDLDPDLPPPLGTSVDLGEWTSSQGGDFGVFEAVRVPALTVAWMNAPLAFRYTAGGTNHDLTLSGASVATSAPVGSNYWYGTHSGEPVALSWVSGVIIQGRMTYSAPGVRAAAMVDTPSGPALIYATVQVSGAINVRMIRNGRDDLIAAGTPGHTSTTPDMAFSPSGDLRLMFVVPATSAANAIVYECTLPAMPAETVNPGAGQVVAPAVAGLGWGLVSNVALSTQGDVQSDSDFSSVYEPSPVAAPTAPPEPLFPAGPHWSVPAGVATRTITSSSTESCSMSNILGAYYDDDGSLVLCQYDIAYDYSAISQGVHTYTGYWGYDYIYGWSWSYSDDSWAWSGSSTRTVNLTAFGITVALYREESANNDFSYLARLVVAHKEQSARSSRALMLVFAEASESGQSGAAQLYRGGQAVGEADLPSMFFYASPANRYGAYTILTDWRAHLRTNATYSASNPLCLGASGAAVAASIGSKVLIGTAEHTAGASPTRLIPATPSQCPGQTDHPDIPSEWPTMGAPPEAFVDINDAREAAGVSRISNSGALAETAAATAAAIIADLEADPEAEVRAPSTSVLIAIGVDSQAHAIEAWLASPAHRTRLLLLGWVAVGAALADSPRGLLVVVHFSEVDP